MIDHEGQRFGRWQVLEPAPPMRDGRIAWHCICDCGTRRVVAGESLRSGSRSCGCSRAQSARDRFTQHGHARITGHSPEYDTWQRMKQRCYYAKERAYAQYGGRGIRVCNQWIASFETFLADVGKRPSAKHTLDRIDSDGDYTPTNVRWATWKEQSLNKRTNRRVTFDGRTQTVTEWAIERGVNRQTLFSRLNRGWSVERALAIH